MVHKKKFLGGLKPLLLLLFIILLGICSTCYAKTTLTDDEAEYLWNYFTKDTYNDEILNNDYNNFYYYNSYLKKYSNIDYKAFQTFFNNNNTYDIDEHTYFFALYQETDIMYLYWWNFNNTIDSNLPYLYLNFNQYNNTVTIYAINDNKTPVSLTGGSLRINGFDNKNYSFDSYSNNTISTSGKSVFKLSSKSFNNNNNNYNTILNPISGLTNFARLPISIVYSNFDGYTYSNEPISYFYLNLFTKAEPEEPSGDSPTDTGLGNITNSSGDNTGNINLEPIQLGLSNIQNQISGDTKKVIENQNQNTQTIVNALSGETEKITNTLTDSADDSIDNTIITSGDIESALNFEIAQDPYSNFWFTLTNNLKSALLGSKRSIDISFQGRTWTISLDEYMVLPAWLVIILTPFSTAFFTWVLVRQFKLIFDKLSSGNVDSLLKENSEERYF